LFNYFAQGGSLLMSIADNIELLRNKIEKVRKNSKIAANNVTLLAASKTQDRDIIQQAIEGGVTVFGENRVQEAEDKWQELKAERPEVQLHLIGPLQTNKARQAVALFDAIQTVDRAKLAEALAREMERVGKQIPCFIEVNIGKESQKAGVLPEETDTLVDYCRTKLALPVAGLMCVPPVGEAPAPHFALLREICLRNGLAELSMGMSEDFETAVRMGSTCVRLGRIIFGERLG
jgi:hypothetical protein